MAGKKSVSNLPELDSTRTKRLAHNIAAWFEKSPRDLPWRKTYDPYGVWIAEIMLQQTQVDTVVPYYQRFLARFPSLRSLAHAKEDDVLLLWSGLGYYSRARNLLRAARTILTEHQGHIPSETAILKQLPGIGLYTAGAIASIAYNQPTPIVDGNVARVLSRIYALPDSPDSTAGKKVLWSLSDALVRSATPRSLNQGMMELGALICAPRSPRCADCPVKRCCMAKREGAPEKYPISSDKTTIKNIREYFAVITRNGRVLMAKRRPDVHYAGLWDLPRIESRNGRMSAVSASFQSQCGLAVNGMKVLDRREYGIMNRRVEAVFLACPYKGKPAPAGDYVEYRWIEFNNLENHAIPAPVRKFLDIYRKNGAAS